MTMLVRFATSAQPDVIAVGVVHGTAVATLEVASMSALLARSSAEIRRLVEAAAPDGIDLTDVRLLAPVDGRTETWAAGVTYERSRQARTEESERSATLYDRVYDAERPELFFKSVSWKLRGPHDEIGVRADSAINVPEPELALAVNRDGDIVGYSICNDVSSRSLEGENALYLPQAKTYAGSCAVGPGITPAWEIADPYTLRIELTIRRAGQVEFTGAASTSQLHRQLPDLVRTLFDADEFPAGVVLSTGTCLVPDLPFTLRDGDIVEISIDGLGTLSNVVRVGKGAFSPETQPA
jgi:2-dehydro-3-deoxy-D-arabinonate dehydratase